MAHGCKFGELAGVKMNEYSRFQLSAVMTFQWTLEEMIAEDDKVAARFTMRGTHRGTHRGTFFGVPPTGKTIAVQAMNFYRLANGQFVQEHGQPDMLGLLQQIGAVPTP